MGSSRGILSWAELASPSTSSQPSTVVSGGSTSKRSPMFRTSRFSGRASPLTGPSSPAPSQGCHCCPSRAVSLAALRDQLAWFCLYPPPLLVWNGSGSHYGPWHAHEVAMRLVPLLLLPRGRTNRFLADVPLLVAQAHPTHLTSTRIAACQSPTHPSTAPSCRVTSRRRESCTGVLCQPSLAHETHHLHSSMSG